MIPVDQVRTGYGRGQCTEASIASLLEVPLDQVPDIWAGPGVPDDAPADRHQPLERREALWRWMREAHGVVEIGVTFSDHPRPPLEAWRFAALFFREHFALELDTEQHRYHLLVGPNPDGVSHQVVGDRGLVVHDPNPMRRGITTCTDVYWLVPIAVVPAEAAHLPSAGWHIAAVEAS